MAIPTLKAVGAFTYSAGAVAIPYPTGASAPIANDIAILVVESENEAISLSVPSGFVELGNQDNKQAGTAGQDPASRLAVYWKRCTGGDTNPTVGDSGNHQTGQIYLFSGVKTTGNPWNVYAEGNDGGVDDFSGVIPGATTTVADCLIFLICTSSYNATSTTEFSSWTNNDLGSITERGDNTNTIGFGGGHGSATGTKAIAGVYGNTTVTLAHTSYKGAMSIALAPPDLFYKTNFSEYTVGQQPADWTERWNTGSGATTVETGTGIGGKQLQLAQSVNQSRYALSWNDVPTDIDITEILVKVKPSANDTFIQGRIVLRGAGTGGAETGYAFGLTNFINIEAYRMVSGTSTCLATSSFSWSLGNWYWVRAKVSGTGTTVTVQMKAWLDGSSEPGSWIIDYSDTDATRIVTPGWMGVASYRDTDDPYYDYFSVGLNGETAPSPTIDEWLAGIIQAASNLPSTNKMIASCKMMGSLGAVSNLPSTNKMKAICKMTGSLASISNLPSTNRLGKYRKIIGSLDALTSAIGTLSKTHVEWLIGIIQAQTNLPSTNQLKALCRMLGSIPVLSNLPNTNKLGRRRRIIGSLAAISNLPSTNKLKAACKIIGNLGVQTALSAIVKRRRRIIGSSIAQSAASGILTIIGAGYVWLLSGLSTAKTNVSAILRVFNGIWERQDADQYNIWSQKSQEDIDTWIPKDSTTNETFTAKDPTNDETWTLKTHGTEEDWE